MRVYNLQIHNTNGSEDFDDLYSFSDFNSLCSEFENKFKYLKTCCEEMIAEEYPHFTGDGDLIGYFKFGNADGSLTIGKVYDYDILDDD